MAKVQFWPGAICGSSFVFVLALLQGFFSRYSGFPRFRIINISIFQFGQYAGPTGKPASADVASSLNIVIILLHLAKILSKAFQLA